MIQCIQCDSGVDFGYMLKWLIGVAGGVHILATGWQLATFTESASPSRGKTSLYLRMTTSFIRS